MIGYLCATPFHIIAAVTMQSGMFSDRKSTLIVMDHFDVTDSVIEKIRDTKIFDEVVLFRNNNKTKLNKCKRLFHSFFPTKLVRKIANHTEYKKFVCFALDFINITYIMKKYNKRGVLCEFSYGDDGIGTYMNPQIYRPRKIASDIMKWTHRLSFLDEIKKVYVYKPEYMVENKNYVICKIEQRKETCEKRRSAVCKIWTLDGNINLDNVILYFQQPNVLDVNGKDLEVEQKILNETAEALGVDCLIKMHPRSMEQNKWKSFEILKTKIPYEVILFYKQCLPKLIMTVNSTAMFSTYLFEDLSVVACPTILLYNFMENQTSGVRAAMNKLCVALNASGESECIYTPDSIDELQKILKGIEG